MSRSSHRSGSRRGIDQSQSQSQQLQNIQEVCLFCEGPWNEQKDHSLCAQKKQALDNQVTEIRDILQRIQKEINPQAKLIENSQVHFIQTVASGILSIQNDYQKLNKTYEDLEYQLNQQGLKSQTALPDLKLRALELSGKYMNFIERNKLLSDRDQNAFSRNIKENLLNFMTKYPDQDHIPIEKLEERLSEQRKINKIQRVVIGILSILVCLSYFQVPSLEIYGLADSQSSSLNINFIQYFLSVSSTISKTISTLKSFNQLNSGNTLINHYQKIRLKIYQNSMETMKKLVLEMTQEILNTQFPEIFQSKLQEIRI